MAAPGMLANVSSRRALQSVHDADQKTKIADGTCFQLVASSRLLPAGGSTTQLAVRRSTVLDGLPGRAPPALSDLVLHLCPEAAASQRRCSDSVCAAHANRPCFQPCRPHRFLMTSVAELGSCLFASSLTFSPRLREPPLAPAPGPGSLGRRTRWES